MTEKRYDVIYEKEPRGQVVTDNGIPCTARTCCTRLNRLEEENEELKQVLGSILIEVKQQISTHKTGEIRAFINPNSFDLISDVLRRYCALKELEE